MKDISVKIEQAKGAIRDALSRATLHFVEFTGGKDSLVTLHLVREVSQRPVSALFIDTSAHFTEVYHFVEKMRKLWKFQLVIEKNQEVIDAIRIGQNRADCCDQLKAKARLSAIRKYGIDLLFTGLNQDDLEDKDERSFFLLKEGYTEVRPILCFSETEVWQYIRDRNLPYCSLYKKGYSHIDCVPCTRTVENAKSIPEEESQEVIRKLRQLGYV